MQIAPSAGYYLQTYHILPNEVKPTGPKNFILKGDVLEFIKANKLQKGQPRAAAATTTSTAVKIEEKSAPAKQAAKTPVAPAKGNNGDFDKFNPKKQSWKDAAQDQHLQGAAQTIANQKKYAPHSYLTSTCTVD